MVCTVVLTRNLMPIPLTTDVDVKVDALSKLQAQFESGIEVCPIELPKSITVLICPADHRSRTANQCPQNMSPNV